jgi:hypothetical protein
MLMMKKEELSMNQDMMVGQYLKSQSTMIGMLSELKVHILLSDKTFTIFFIPVGLEGYEIGYATAPSITGPWTKAGINPFYGAQSKQACTKNGFEWKGDPNTPFNQVGHNEGVFGARQ